MVDFLINSLGFSKDESFSVSTKLSHLKSTQNPISVIGFFKNCDLDNTQIKNIVRFSPKILTANVDKTLEPKLRAVQDLGLSGSGLENLFRKSRNISSKKLSDNVIFLRELLGSDAKVCKVLQRTWLSLSEQKMSHNLQILNKYGLSNAKMKTLVLQDPNVLLTKSKYLESSIKKVEPVFGIRPNSPRFGDGIEMIVSMSKSTLERKLQIFRSFGWLDSDILTMTRTSPFCLKRSEAKLKVSLNFFMNELGFTAAYVATHPKLLVYSLEKRVMPRNKVLQILNDKKLLKSKYSLCTGISLSEKKFMKYFVFPYQECVPHLYEVYTNASGHHQAIK
uniref:uncharacterized protein LOC122586662 n=1 Tax=Erigeron canadensis TaxID=72917 RepID=UPI001CB93297|nr:uncharacterized protein LOC122586662 [Erigeron canadensis]